jgi:hypothetical protein
LWFLANTSGLPLSCGCDSCWTAVHTDVHCPLNKLQVYKAASYSAPAYSAPTNSARPYTAPAAAKVYQTGANVARDY